MEKQPARDKQDQTRRAKRPLRPQIDTPSKDDQEKERTEHDLSRIGDAPRTRTEMPPSLSELPG